MINANITLHIEIKTAVIYSFKSEIHRGAGEIVHCSINFTTRYVYKFRGDSGIHRGPWTKNG